MSKKVRFPLKMANDTQVRSLEDLRENFDLASVLAYYDNGKLYEWLADRYYENEAAKAKALNPSENGFKKSLCDIFDVPYLEDEADNVDLQAISSRNERLEQLRKFTADDKILAAADRVAFSQEELADLLDDGVKEIYLCGERFKIPGSKKGVTYIGVNNPEVDIPDEYSDNGIVLQGMGMDIDEMMQRANEICEEVDYLGYDEDEYDDVVELVGLWRKAAALGNAEAQTSWAQCLMEGVTVDSDEEEAVKWFLKAIKQGHKEALSELMYLIRKKSVDLGIDELRRIIVDNGDVEIICHLAREYPSGSGKKYQAESIKLYNLVLEKDELCITAITALQKLYRIVDVMKWDYAGAAKFYRMLIERNIYEQLKDKLEPMNVLHSIWRLNNEYGDKAAVAKEVRELLKFLHEAADKGDAKAQYDLAGLYRDGLLVERDFTEAINLLKKSVAQGYNGAQLRLDNTVLQEARIEEIREELPEIDLLLLNYSEEERLELWEGKS